VVVIRMRKKSRYIYAQWVVVVVALLIVVTEATVLVWKRADTFMLSGLWWSSRC